MRDTLLANIITEESTLDPNLEYYFEIEGTTRYGSFIEIKGTNNFLRKVSIEAAHVQALTRNKNVQILSTQDKTSFGIRWEKDSIKYWRDLYLVPKEVEKIPSLVKKLSDRYKINEDTIKEVLYDGSPLRLPEYDRYGNVPSLLDKDPYHQSPEAGLIKNIHFEPKK